MSKSKIVFTCPDHEGFKLTGKKGWCKKCRKHRSDGIERPPQAPVAKIDLDALMKDIEIPAPIQIKAPTVSETLAQLPMNYRNIDLCPTCNPVVELPVSTNRHPVATDKILDGMVVEEMITYLQQQYGVAPETNNIGQAPRMLVKAQIIRLQHRLGIHKAN